MKTTKTLGLMLMACATVSPTYACDENYPDIWEEEINFCRDNQEEITTIQNDTTMANKFTNAVAMIALALASSQSVNAEMIRSLAGECGIDETSAYEIAEEVMSAKEVAERDMRK